MSAAKLPEPPISCDTDVRDLDGFMLNVERLMASELVALSSHEVVAAALFLWCRAWKQLPAASLPDDERVLAAFAKLPLQRFIKLRAQVMRGFTKCTDGRLYHSVLVEEAIRAFERKQVFRRRRETDAERLRKWREAHRETRVETRFVAEGVDRDRDGSGQGVDRDGTSKPKDSGTQPSVVLNTQAGEQTPEPGLFDSQDPGPPTHRASRSGTRLDENWVLPKQWGEWALAERPKWSEDDVRTVAAMFRNYWVAKTGKDATKRDWKATWQNWVLKEPEVRRMNGSARSPPMSVSENNRAVGERWLAKHGAIDGESRRVSDD